MKVLQLCKSEKFCVCNLFESCFYFTKSSLHNCSAQHISRARNLLITPLNKRTVRDNVGFFWRLYVLWRCYLKHVFLAKATYKSNLELMKWTTVAWLHLILTHFAVFSSSVLTQFPLRFTLDRNAAANDFSGLDFLSSHRMFSALFVRR